MDALFPNDPRSDVSDSERPDDAGELLGRAQHGDSDALETLFRRQISQMRGWAHGRLPSAARDLMDTDDVVQDTFVRLLRLYKEFEQRHEGAFDAYLKTALKNRIRDEVRRIQRQPTPVDFDKQEFSSKQSPLADVMTGQRLDAYEACLKQLDQADRLAVVARVELGCSYAEVADFVKLSSADAARMRVNRSLKRLTQCMKQRLKEPSP